MEESRSEAWKGAWMKRPPGIVPISTLRGTRVRVWRTCHGTYHVELKSLDGQWFAVETFDYYFNARVRAVSLWSVMTGGVR